MKSEKKDFPTRIFSLEYLKARLMKDYMSG
jgi:hypothetical protein